MSSTMQPLTACLEECSTCGKLAVAGATVTIPALEYKKLLELAATQLRKGTITRYRALSRSGIGLKPELAEFIMENAPTMTIAKIHEACCEKFGADAPSTSSIYRFIDKMRKSGS